MILVDERIRYIEYKYLVEDLKQEVKRIPLSDDVYEEISGHSDIFYTKIGGKIYAAPNAPIIENNFTIGEEKVSRKYPEDVKYNICQIGKFTLHMTSIYGIINQGGIYESNQTKRY